MKVKHIVIGMSLLGGGLIYVQQRVKTLAAIMVKLIPIPTGIRNISFSKGVFKCNLDITLHNPTAKDFNPNGIIVTVKRLDIKDKAGVLLGKVNINKNSVNIPANGKFVLKDLVIEIDSQGLLLNLSSLLKIRSIKDIKADVVIGILGTEYVIPQL